MAYFQTILALLTIVAVMEATKLHPRSKDNDCKSAIDAWFQYKIGFPRPLKPSSEKKIFDMFWTKLHRLPRVILPNSCLDIPSYVQDQYIIVRAPKIAKHLRNKKGNQPELEDGSNAEKEENRRTLRPLLPASDTNIGATQWGGIGNQQNVGVAQNGPRAYLIPSNDIGANQIGGVGNNQGVFVGQNRPPYGVRQLVSDSTNVGASQVGGALNKQGVNVSQNKGPSAALPAAAVLGAPYAESNKLDVKAGQTGGIGNSQGVNVQQQHRRSSAASADVDSLTESSSSAEEATVEPEKSESSDEVLKKQLDDLVAMFEKLEG